jgi:hypothetical protein
VGAVDAVGRVNESALTLAQLAPSLDAAQRVGSATPATLLALALLAVGAALLWCVREIARLNRELLAVQEARRQDTERMLTVQIGREGTVTTAMVAITDLPAVIEALPASLREILRDELGRASDTGRHRR